MPGKGLRAYLDECGSASGIDSSPSILSSIAEERKKMSVTGSTTTACWHLVRWLVESFRIHLVNLINSLSETIDGN
jgi:hypothetical protein